MSDAATDAGTISWTRDRSPLLRSFAERYRAEKPFEDLTVGVCAPLTPHTGLFVETLRAGDGSVAVTGELEASPGFHPVPDRLDRDVAHRKLETMDVEIDALTAEQRAYNDRWER